MHDFKFNRKREETLEVGDANAISFLGPEGPRVLSTPNMILGMEQACRNLILEMLAPGHDSVGTHVNVAHKAAAPLGSTVVFSAELIEVNDRRAEFRVAATLNGKIVQFDRQMNTDWYRDTTFDYLVYDSARPWHGVNATSAIATFGAPTQVYSVGSYRVMTWQSGIRVTGSLPPSGSPLTISMSTPSAPSRRLVQP